MQAQHTVGSYACPKLPYAPSRCCHNRPLCAPAQQPAHPHAPLIPPSPTFRQPLSAAASSNMMPELHTHIVTQSYTLCAHHITSPWPMPSPKTSRTSLLHIDTHTLHVHAAYVDVVAMLMLMLIRHHTVFCVTKHPRGRWQTEDIKRTSWGLPHPPT